MEEQSESDRDMSDDNDGEDDDNDDAADNDDDDDDDTSDTDSEASDADESVWDPLVEEAKDLHRNDYDELVQEFVNDGLDEDEAKNKAYHRILPVLQREARHLYLEKLKWIRELRQDPIHQKVMETKKRFREEDGFDGEEALEAAVKKRKFLLNRIFEDDAGYHDNNDEGSDEEHY